MNDFCDVTSPPIGRENHITSYNITSVFQDLDGEIANISPQICWILRSSDDVNKQ